MFAILALATAVLLLVPTIDSRSESFEMFVKRACSSCNNNETAETIRNNCRLLSFCEIPLLGVDNVNVSNIRPFSVQEFFKDYIAFFGIRLFTVLLQKSQVESESNHFTKIGLNFFCFSATKNILRRHPSQWIILDQNGAIGSVNVSYSSLDILVLPSSFQTVDQVNF